jgi:AraC-like DNA-binding protein
MLRIRQVNPEVLAARLRMDDGLALMGAGLSVKETAARLGYTAQSHFCRHFREVYGVPPTEYKRRLKGNAAVQTR